MSAKLPWLHTCLGCVAFALYESSATAAHTAPDPGFVAGDARPACDGPSVKVAGGWMVPYDETIPGSDVTFTMIPIPGGTFRIGSPEGEEGRMPDEGPTFEVKVEPIWMGKHEVTWAEYKQYMAAYELFGKMAAADIRPVTEANQADAVTAPTPLVESWMNFTNGEEPDQPAVTMTQFAARQYTKWLTGLTGRFYRIPAESEWEYACRAGSDTPFSSGDAESLDGAAWFTDNSDDTTHPVGRKKPNGFGLHDMHGNVAEWVVDELVAAGYANSAKLPQPVGMAETIQWPVRLYPRVLRGGAYYDEASECRSASRRGSQDAGGTRDCPDWKDVDPCFPKSAWWYTEEPTLGVGMRIVRPFLIPADVAERRRWWEADEQSMQEHVRMRLEDGRGKQAVVDPDLPALLKKEGIE